VTERARAEYASVPGLRYARATKAQRSTLLDEYCGTAGCHRKAAIRALRRLPRAGTRPPGRPRRYPLELEPLLERIWIASDYLSGKLLAAVLPVLLAAPEQHHGLVVTPAARAALVGASPATLDRLLHTLRRRRGRPPRRLAPAVGTVRARRR
jgi:hypothetical protein